MTQREYRNFTSSTLLWELRVVIFILLFLSSCSKPLSLKSTLSERLSRSPETASSFGDSDSEIGDGRLKEELSRFNSLQNIPDSDAQFYYLKGELQFSRDKYEDALQSYKTAEDYLPLPSVLIAKRIIQIYLKIGDLSQAILAAEDYQKKFPKNSQILEALAGAYSAVGRNTEAIDVYKTLVEVSSGKKRGEFLMMLASLYTINNDPVEAKKSLKQAQKEDPDNSLAIYYLGRVEELEGDLVSAEKKYRQAAKKSPDSDGLQLELARLLAQTNRLEEAKKIAQLVVDRSPQNPLARQLLGQLLLATNNIDGALSELEKLQSMENNPTDTRLKIALINLERRDFEAAEKELNLVLATRPSDSVALYYISLAYAGQNKVSEVVSTVKKILEKDRFFVESRLVGSFILKQAKRESEAISLLKTADEKLLPTTEPRILSPLVSMLREQGLTEDAINYQRRMIAAEPDRDTNYFLLAILLDEGKRYEESIATCIKAVELNPKNADALNFVGYSLAEHTSKYKEARRYIEAALVLDPKNGYYIDSLGWIYFREGDFAKALVELEKAVELVPSDAVILEHLAEVYFQLGEFVKSDEILTRALQNADRSDDKGVSSRLNELRRKLDHGPVEK